MIRKAWLVVAALVISPACAIPPSSGPMARWSPSQERTARDSSGRCDYGLEGAVGVGTAVAVIGLVRGRPAEQLAYMVPISAGLGWLWGRFLMPERPRCRATAEPESRDTTQTRERGA